MMHEPNLISTVTAIPDPSTDLAPRPEAWQPLE